MAHLGVELGHGPGLLKGVKSVDVALLRWPIRRLTIRR